MREKAKREYVCNLLEENSNNIESGYEYTVIAEGWEDAKDLYLYFMNWECGHNFDVQDVICQQI